MAYQLGIDLGTTCTRVAICRPAAAGAEPVTLGAGSDVVASTVFLGADGAVVVGEAAARRGLADPTRVAHGFVHRIGDAMPVLVGGRPVPAEVLAAMFLAHLVHDVRAREGEPPSRVAVAHPAGWGEHRVAALGSALAGQGVGPVLLLPAPRAAAAGAGSGRPGAVVAVYDLGGTTSGAAVVRACAGGGYELVGTAGTAEGFGGTDVDDVVLGFVREAVGAAWDGLAPADPEVLAAVARLRRECTSAKETLSADTEVRIPVMLPSVHTTVRLTRAELEERIRPAVLGTVEALERVLDSAGVDAAALDGLLLAGGSARIPLVAELVPAGVGRAAAAGIDPGRVTAAGAAVAARAAEVAAASVVAGHGPADPGPADDGDAGPEAEPTAVVALDRPAKQARPFAGAEPPSGSRRRLALALATGLAVAVVAGGAVAYGATRTGGGGAATPTPVPAATSVAGDPAPGRARVPAPQPRTVPAPARGTAPAPTAPPTAVRTAPPTTTAAPATTAPATAAPTAAVEATASPPGSTAPETDPVAGAAPASSSAAGAASTAGPVAGA